MRLVLAPLSAVLAVPAFAETPHCQVVHFTSTMDNVKPVDKKHLRAEK